MHDALPLDVLQGSTLSGNEYGWTISSFPAAIAKANSHGYACLGGQFQFRLEDGTTCEMYWLAADSSDRASGESWADYSHRSCTEVLSKFEHLIATTDFGNEALKWGADPAKTLVFTAYFVNETDFTELGRPLRA